MSQTIKIEMETHGLGRVFVDDTELKGVVAARVRVGVGQTNQILLALRPESMEITGPFDVVTAQEKN
ncbi:hypothetical protein [Castellaniella sp.]|uniref:hypothetical protein n=1 Tax=Castellaniella sp. TaxID=1955812 RepID=UPI003560853A